MKEFLGQFWLRWLLSSGLLVGVFFETGPFTSLSIGLVIVASEHRAFLAWKRAAYQEVP